MFLVALDELALYQLLERATAHRVAIFQEPDLGYALTAIALEPAARQLVQRYPLAFSVREEVKK